MSNECETACSLCGWLADWLAETVIRLLFFKMSTQISAATNCAEESERTFDPANCERTKWRTVARAFVPPPRWSLDKLLSVFFFVSLSFFPVFSVFWFFRKSLFCHTAFHQCHDDWHAKKYVCIRLYCLFFSSRCFVWNSSGRIMFTFFVVVVISMEKWRVGGWSCGTVVAQAHKRAVVRFRCLRTVWKISFVRWTIFETSRKNREFSCFFSASFILKQECVNFFLNNYLNGFLSFPSFYAGVLNARPTIMHRSRLEYWTCRTQIAVDFAVLCNEHRRPYQPDWPDVWPIKKTMEWER